MSHPCSRQSVLADLRWLMALVLACAMAFQAVTPTRVSAHPPYYNVVGLNPAGANTYPYLNWWNQNTRFVDQVNVAKL